MDLFWIFEYFFDFLEDFLDYFWIFWIIFGFFLDFFLLFLFFFYGFFSKLLWLLLKITKVTTGHQKWPKQHNKLFFAQKTKKASAEGPSPPQELEVGPRSGPYLLVSMKKKKIY